MSTSMVAGVGGHLVPVRFQKLCQLCIPFRLGEGFAAGEGHTPAEGVAPDDFQDGFLLHGRAAAEFPGFRVMAAGTMVGTTLAEDGHPDAGTIHDGVGNDAA